MKIHTLSLLALINLTLIIIVMGVGCDALQDSNSYTPSGTEDPISDPGDADPNDGSGGDSTTDTGDGTPGEGNKGDATSDTGNNNPTGGDGGDATSDTGNNNPNGGGEGNKGDATSDTGNNNPTGGDGTPGEGNKGDATSDTGDKNPTGGDGGNGDGGDATSDTGNNNPTGGDGGNGDGGDATSDTGDKNPTGGDGGNGDGGDATSDTGKNNPDTGDTTSPSLQSTTVVAERRVEMCFDEPVTVIPGTAQIDNGVTLEASTDTQCGIALTFDTTLKPEVSYTVTIEVQDSSGNSKEVTAQFYGYNSAVASVHINEFTTRGSGNHPDTVELYVVQEGTIGGITLYEGTATQWESRKILPSVVLPTGSYILVHFKPDGIAVEIDETADSAASGGKDAHPDAWDFWVRGESGLSGNNGALTLYNAPDGTLLDAALYTNRTSASDTNYRGFGSAKFMQQVDEIVNSGEWTVPGALARPEDLIYSDNSTATRSLNRSSTSADTNAATDWHTVPTSGYTFGEVNSDEKYVKN